MREELGEKLLRQEADARESEDRWIRKEREWDKERQYLEDELNNKEIQISEIKDKLKKREDEVKELKMNMNNQISTVYEEYQK